MFYLGKWKQYIFYTFHLIISSPLPRQLTTLCSQSSMMKSTRPSLCTSSWIVLCLSVAKFLFCVTGRTFFRMLNLWVITSRLMPGFSSDANAKASICYCKVGKISFRRSPNFFPTLKVILVFLRLELSQTLPLV